MRKLSTIFVLIMAITTFSFNANAQWGGAGIKGGLTYSNLYIDEDDLDDENARLGFHVGIYSQMMFSEGFGIQPEILYTTKGAEATYSGLLNQTVDFRLGYIDVPILLVLRPVEFFEIHAGPYVGWLLHSNISFDGTFEGESEINRDHLNTFDYGIVAGIALNFQAVKVGLRYSLGLPQLQDSTVTNLLLGDSKNAYGQLYLAFNLSYR